jgi:hypothetical protein
MCSVTLLLELQNKVLQMSASQQKQFEAVHGRISDLSEEQAKKALSRVEWNLTRNILYGGGDRD